MAHITSKCLITTIILLLIKCAQFLEINHGNELQQSVNLGRQEYVQRMCDLYKNFGNKFEDLQDKDLEHILVDRERRLLYCYVPKVACTNWKRVLLYLTYKDKPTNSSIYQKLNQYNITDVESIPAKLVHSSGTFENLGQITDVQERSRILNEYTKFIMIRHPFDRLLSAFRNKLQGDSASALYFQSRIGRYIIKKFRKNPSKSSLDLGNDVTFQEFCQYLISIAVKEPLSGTVTNKSTAEIFNEHWTPAFDLCHPCLIKYNVIGKYETLIDDAKLLLSLIDADNSVRFPQSITHYSAANSTTTAAVDLNQQQKTNRLSKELSLLSVEMLEKLYRVYENDFKVFGYGLESLLGYEIA